VKANYYSVIFSNERSQLEDSKYHEFSNQMLTLVQHAEGFLGMESYRENSGRGVTISYWETLEAIQKWKENTQHRLAQEYGKAVAYSQFTTRICEVLRAYSFNKKENKQ
jgi:heme-degrading monooxygenase HmoA